MGINKNHNKIPNTKQNPIKFNMGWTVLNQSYLKGRQGRHPRNPEQSYYSYEVLWVDKR
jgi:hypothetical protein